MTRRLLTPVLLLAPAALAVSLLAACAGQTETPQASTGLPLESTSWGLASYSDDAGALQSVPTDVTVTAQFSDGTVSGSGGCNRYSAGYEVDGSTLTIGPPAATLIGCPEPQGSVEQAFFVALGEVTSYSSDEASLTLSNGDGEPLLVFEVVEAVSLTGTQWSATGVNNGKQAVVSLVTGTTITATFGEDGTVSGSAGCNRYNGGYTADAATIDIGPLASTRKACEPDVMTQEAAFLAAMENATTVTIDGSSLELRDADGALQVSFTAE
jgi:heat shock protein HslJ